MRRAPATLVCLALVLAGTVPGLADNSGALEVLGRSIDSGNTAEAGRLADELLQRIDAETASASRSRAERLDALLGVLRDRFHVGGPMALEPVWVDRAGEAARGLARNEGAGSEVALLAAARHVLMLAGDRRVEEAGATLERLAPRIDESGSGRARARYAFARSAVAKLENDPSSDSLLASAIDLLRAELPEEEGWWAEAEGERRLQLVRSGRAAEAIPYAKRYLDDVERRHGPDTLPTVHALFNVVMASYSAQRWEETIPIAERLVGILRQSYGEQHPRLLVPVNFLGVSLLNLGRYREARDVYERVLAAFEDHAGPVASKLAGILNNAATVHQALGDFVHAYELRERAIEQLESSEDPFTLSLLATTLRRQAEGLIALGDLDEADGTLRRALELQQRFHGPSHSEVAGARLRLGTLALRREDWSAAEREFRTAIEALGSLEKGTSADLSLAELWLGKARVLAHDGRIADAIAQARRVLATYERVAGPENPRRHVALLWLARFHRQAMDAAAAEAITRQIVQEREARGLTRDSIFSEALEERAEALWMLGERVSALDAAGRASRALDTRLFDLVAAFPEDRVERMLCGHPHPESFFFEGLLDTAPAIRDPGLREAWAWTLRRRGLLLEELALRHRGAAMRRDTEQSALWTAFVEARRRLAALWVGGPGDDPGSFASEVAAAITARDDAETALIARHRTLGRPLEARRVSLEELRDAIPSRTTLVEIVRAPVGNERRDVALILRADRSLDAVELGPSAEIDALVARYREQLTRRLGARSPSSLEPVFATGRALRARIWDPIVARAGDIEHLLLVPDGPYQLLHPGALPLGDGRFVLESDPSIHLLSTSPDLVRAAGHGPPAGKGMLALGAPDFGASSHDRLARLDTSPAGDRYRGVPYGCFGMRRVAWADLPETRSELQDIARLYEPYAPVDVRVGNAASEEALRAVLPGKRFAHIATHGFFVAASECKLATATPLLRSGLILAGANRRDADTQTGSGDDGVLTAEEIATLDLGGVERVVLSGCDTGRGDVSIGEGVLGMRRALEIAGVRTVVMSLAPVSDAWTERWMDAFYRELIDGRPTRQAARTASLHCLAGLRDRGLAPHPYLWAGFVSSGDWR